MIGICITRSHSFNIIFKRYKKASRSKNGGIFLKRAPFWEPITRCIIIFEPVFVLDSSMPIFNPFPKFLT